MNRPTNNNPNQARKSLEELKSRLQQTQPIYVDSKGRLQPEESTPEDEDNPKAVQIKPSRWF